MSSPNAFWHNAIIDKSFEFLQELRRRFDFVLIGGWAVYFYTKSLKWKDIDFVCDYETLTKLKQEFNIIKNERLHKYELKAENFDVVIYLPHWSELGLPAENIMQSAVYLDGFKLPGREKLLILKLFIYKQR